MDEKKAILENKAKDLNCQSVTPEERRSLIAVAAYYRAERRGFVPGKELQDWFEAEAEIAERFGEGSIPQGTD
jgi:hypothetical protein